MRFILVLVLLAILLPASIVEAQDMHIQYYLVPVQQIGLYRGPSYLKWRWNPGGLDVQKSCKDYGSINQMICAVNAEIVAHTWLAAQASVYQFPIDIEVNPSPAELSELETALEAVYIPADWLSPSETWRGALRTVTGMFLYMQRVTAITGDNPLTDWGVTLNTQFRNLDQDKQDALIQATNDLGYDSSVIRDNWTLRIILKNMADGWGDRPIYFGFTTL